MFGLLAHVCRQRADRAALMKALNVFMIALEPEPAAWAKARIEGKPTVMAAAAVMRRRLRRDCIRNFTSWAKCL